MRIALVSWEYPPDSHGGIGTQMHMKAHGLSALGHEVYVIAYSDKTDRYEYMDGPIHVIRIPGFRNQMPLYAEIAEWLTYSVAVAIEVSALHSKSPLDLIEFPEWHSEGYAYLLNRTKWNYVPVAIQLHVPIVMLAHTVDWPKIDSDFYKIGAVMENTCLRLADGVYSSSDCSTDWCVKYYGLQREKIPTLHTGVDTSLFFPREAPRGNKPTIIFVGRIKKEKGADLLVKVAGKLIKKHPGLRLKMIGAEEVPNFIQKLKAEANTLNCSPDLLFFPGYLSREELPQHLSSAYVFAMPSPYEPGPGLVYLEAMACGLPVIGCNSGGTPEIIRHGENGFLIPPGDVEALTKALDLLLSDPKLREKMGQNARHYVLENADSRKCLKRLEQFYIDIISSKTQNEI